MFLHSYSSLRVVGSRQGTESFRTGSVDKIMRLSVEDFVIAAKIAELEEDSHWYERLAKGFRAADHIDASVSEFHVASDWIRRTSLPAMAWALHIHCKRTIVQRSTRQSAQSRIRRNIKPMT